jgi:hypothetical protein
MKQEQVTNNSCEFCNRGFIRENTFLKHICEQKRRWLDKDKPGNRIGFNAWKTYFQRHHPNKKNTEYKDFLKNSYYNAFLKFGNYCVDVDVIDTFSFFNYLLSNRVPIDSWASDITYTKYLVEYLVLEDALDAVKRSVNHLIDLSNKENILLSDVFKYINSNKLCYDILKGKISPWVLYQSETGKVFLSNLNPNQTSLIFDYIDPKKWNIKFKREDDVISEVKHILNNIPL